MEQTISYPMHVVQFFAIMNQLHRLAMQYPDWLPPGMTVPQLATVSYLALTPTDGGDVYQRDLEKAFKLRRSTISSLLNTLERKGLLRREPVPQDARLKKLVLTPEGDRIGAQVQSLFHQANELMVKDFTPEERDTLVSLLQRVAHNMNQVEA